jgi:leader peptidase (prepilin peptidase) / N-methyltransferase
LTLPAAVGTIVLLTADAALHDRWKPTVAAAAAAIITAALFLIVAVTLGRRGLGPGDAKLMLSVAALIGWWGAGALFLTVFLAFIASGLAGVALLIAGKATRPTHIPMAPTFVLATLIALGLHAGTPYRAEVRWCPPT